MNNPYNYVYTQNQGNSSVWGATTFMGASLGAAGGGVGAATLYYATRYGQNRLNRSARPEDQANAFSARVQRRYFGSGWRKAGTFGASILAGSLLGAASLHGAEAINR